MSAIHPQSPPGRPEQAATRLVFFIAGFGMAAWAPLVPFAKARAQLDEGALGLLLLCLGAGSIAAMPVAGALAARWGCRMVIAASTILLCLALPLLASLSGFAGLAASLLAFGAGVGSLDVAMNIQAVIVERAGGRTMMSGFHGMFSLGGIAGPGCVAVFLALGASPVLAAWGVVGGIVLALVLAAPRLLPYGSRSDGPAFAIPRGIVVFIGILCFVVFLAEGSLLDWSAVFLASVHGMDPARAGLGYAAFAVTMTIGRLTGDRVVSRLGPVRIVAIGGAVAAAGTFLATLGPNWQTALVGYALVGAGCANIVPVLFSATGRQTDMPESVAIPAIITMGYAGILAGPAGIGFLAHAFNLQAAFCVLAVLLLGVAAGSVRLRRLAG